MNPNKLKQLIMERRTIHNYNNTKIDDKIISEAINCFIHAPNHHNTHPWKLTIANPEQRVAIADQTIELKKQKKQLSETEVMALKTKYLNPSHLIALLQIKCDDPIRSKEDYAAISCAIMNAKLYLWSNNIGTKWSSGKTTKSKKTYEILEVDSEKYEIIGFLWAGYFDRLPVTPKKQKPNEVWL